MNSIIKETIEKMSLEQKASLCSAADFWHTKSCEDPNVQAVMVCDGPHGLRKQEKEVDHAGIAESVKAIAFPTASAMACSFDRDLIHEVGEALGEECQAEDIAVLLGPGLNMKRSPLCGRNFEYYSEDPYLAGELGSAFINGVQSRNVGTSLKHFAANNQEWRRMTISSEIDKRTLRETYLSAFERVVKKAQPWTIMCSYNRINGTYSCENDWLLNKVLRDEWGFEGLVMTDWGAMNKRVPALKAGLDLEMPASHGETDKQIVAAVKDGSLSMEVLDKAVERIITLSKKYHDNHVENATYNKEVHHNLSKKVAENSAVLLKNDGILPIKSGQKIALIGEFAKNPRLQGGGSSHINCTNTENAFDAMKAYEQEGFCTVSYAQGYQTKEDITKQELLDEAVQTAKEADIAIIFAGLPDAFESEGYDRTHLNMPNCQNELIDAVCTVQPNTVVVLHNGSPILMPWLSNVSAVLEMYLAGQASGAAATELLFGKVNPSGKLAETFPLRVQDNPSYLNFPGNRDKVCYNEGVFIGYRYYDKKEMPVLFPFGYGLSYTTFSYSNVSISINGTSYTPEKLSTISVKDTDQITVSADITNTGDIAGAEIIQLYVKNGVSDDLRPEKELKNFAKVMLQPGETKTVTMELDKRSFAYYHVGIHDWYAPSGTYTICLGASSRDIQSETAITIVSTTKIPFVAGDTTTFEDVKRFAKDVSPLMELKKKSGFGMLPSDGDDETVNTEMAEAMEANMPLHSIISFCNDDFSIEEIEETIRALNEGEK